MGRLVLIISLVLASCSSCAGRLYVTPEAQEKLGTIDAVTLLHGLPGLTGFTVTVSDCGFYNAWARIPEREILLCSEVAYQSEGVVRMTLLHEAAHVMFRVGGVPFTGMEELAADEFATIRSIELGRREDVLEKIRFWHAFGDTQDNGIDPHPSGERRAAHMTCLYLGSGPRPTHLFTLSNWEACRDTYLVARRNWRVLLEDGG